MSIKSNLKPLIVILGQTASGKTDLAIKLAKKYQGEIICADSQTIYKGMNIGTAKPKGKKSIINNHPALIVRKIPHYMIDIVKPNQTFSVGQFKNLAIKIIKDIHRRGKIPFLVGGTGLYISAIVDNLEIPRVRPDRKLRKKLEEQAKKYGLNYLYKKLLKLDPEAKNFVQKENLRRVIRALEVCLKTKNPFSQLRQKGKPLFNVLQIGVKIPRPLLYQRINQRVDKIIKLGLIQEVKKLVKKYSFNFPAMDAIGYRQIGLYLNKKISLKQAIELIKRDTRHYAKRQMTWFKRDKRIHWVSPDNFQIIQKLIKNFIEKNPV
ncbi:MAG: tRNA (adenosine(37)-N6)-dimethylallyltransferase MiaA [Minisyncoccia bacterium]